ncbi:MAG: TPM domain-containing protein [Patescibacteria group bacterium]|nr:TPM domain-containing protein [Patescibacteria group bacterium]MDE2438033.1 TPM domain-containing protein [Patescibacteria group bacterium]
MKRIAVLMLGVMIFLMSGCTPAVHKDLKPTGYVNDFANVLSLQTKGKLESDLLNYKKTTTNEVVVVTVDSLDGQDIADFANHLARKWGIGTKEKNNGVLILVVKDTGKRRIEVGRGLEGVLPDATAKSILLETRPQFKNRQYDEGVSLLVEKVVLATKGEYKAPPTEEQRFIAWFISLAWWEKVLFVIGALILLCLVIAALGSDSGSAIVGAFIGGALGGDDSGGGGFGGFGGGDFGGGGASD